MTLVDVVRAADDRDDRPEGLLMHELGLRRHVVEHGRRIERPAAVVAVQQGGALRDGIVDARLEQARRALVDDGADIGGRVHRIAGLEGLGSREHLLHEFVGDALDDEDALHGGAALAGILGGALHGELGRLVEIGVLHDDQRIVAAELEHDAPVAGLLGDVFADPAPSP